MKGIFKSKISLLSSELFWKEREALTLRGGVGLNVPQAGPTLGHGFSVKGENRGGLMVRDSWSRRRGRQKGGMCVWDAQGLISDAVLFRARQRKPVCRLMFTVDSIIFYTQQIYPRGDSYACQAKQSVSQVVVPNQAPRDAPRGRHDTTMFTLLLYGPQPHPVTLHSLSDNGDTQFPKEIVDPIRKALQELVNPNLRQIVEFLNKGLQGVI